MFTQRKCGLTIHRKEKNIIANIIKRYGERAEQKYLSVPIAKATSRAAKYCNVSSRIQCIRIQSINCALDAQLSTPGKTQMSKMQRWMTDR
jgi:hypothetical protein